ncbi:MAG: TonB-dependent receptor, partial [Desulfobacteraceae bacterium 4572_19]
MKKLYLVMTSVILLSGGAGLLFAEQQKPEFVTNIDEVVVTAGRVDEKKWNVPVNITVITTEDIAQSTGRNIGDLLAEDGTGHIHKYPGGLTSVGIRGFRTDSHGNDLLGHVLVLVNGRRAATGNVAKIPLENVERVEIIRGPAATQYGSAAMGGVINIITLQGKDKPSVFLDQAFGS